jgi:hypothetical protein
VSFNATVEVAFVFQVIVSVPEMLAVAPAISDQQFPATACLSVAVIFAPVTPPPVQPLNVPVTLIVGFTLVVAFTFGNGGVNVAVPIADLHVVPVAAPAGDAIKPAGNTIAAAKDTPATVRIPIPLWLVESHPVVSISGTIESPRGPADVHDMFGTRSPPDVGSFTGPHASGTAARVGRRPRLRTGHR